MLLGGVPMLPGGIDGAEGTTIGLLLVGVDAGAAVTATAGVRLATLGFGLLLGFAVLPVAVRRPREPARRGRPLLAPHRGGAASRQRRPAGRQSFGVRG